MTIFTERNVGIVPNIPPPLKGMVLQKRNKSYWTRWAKTKKGVKLNDILNRKCWECSQHPAPLEGLCPWKTKQMTLIDLKHTWNLSTGNITLCFERSQSWTYNEKFKSTLMKKKNKEHALKFFFLSGLEFTAAGSDWMLLHGWMALLDDFGSQD